MILLLRLSGENLKLSKFEVESIFKVPVKLKGNSAELNVNMSRTQLVDKLETTSMVKKAYIDNAEIWRVRQGRFNDREPIKKPAFNPTSLKPKLARLLVNLAQPKKVIIDPFCGTGSIMLEAGLLGYRAIGIDIEWKSSQRAKQNLRHYGSKYHLNEEKDWQVVIGDSTKIDKLFKSIDAIATDPPYGRSSTLAGRKVKELYEEFLKSASKVVKGRLVIVKPKDLKITIPKALKKLGTFDLYVHRGLTREIMVLERNKKLNS